MSTLVISLTCAGLLLSFVGMYIALRHFAKCHPERCDATEGDCSVCELNPDIDDRPYGSTDPLL